MTTDPMVLAQLRLAAAVMDTLDEMARHRHRGGIQIERLVTGEDWCNVPRVRDAIRHLRAIEAQAQEVGS
jgi:hypothetical protein